ncbi:two-component system sensor histidine kinase ResE [Paenibacillus castaneae]|uniref:HAMP domain-containing sensor histidine kinase n=1 Tax=Paenibacillus castaneae TaxID=474957 RepID=UPI000C9C6200|nr:ATP-binding protein [Paenibacillus castaneae]NIK77548.1 two-component system sensor histidine kinase ResE [Paenibacillus castaneae]
MNLWHRTFGKLLRSVVVKLWGGIMLLVAVVLLIVGGFLIQYVDIISFDDAYKVKFLFILTAVIGFLLSTFFAFFLSTKIQQPLLQLKKAADSVSQGDYSTRVNIRSSDEIGELANTFNHMTEQLDKLIHDINHEKNHLSSILRSMGDSVITFDAEGKVILTNPSGHLLINQWSGIEFAWQEDLFDNGASNSEVPIPLRELFHKVMEEGCDGTDKINVLSSVWSVVMAPLQSKGVVRGAVAVMRNVTEEHKLEKLRRDFVANISHEIRTPLSMLQGYSEALLDDIVVSPEDRKDLVQVIHDESLRMGRLVNDFLDIARMEAGHTDMNFQEIDLRHVVKRVHRKFQVFAKEREVRLFAELPDQPLLVKEADEDRLEQVLTNLMDNALRHTPSGKAVTISGKLVIENDVEYVQLMVKDEGQGIPTEDVPYIFERFYKADKSRKRGSSSGTGLGLAIVRNLIELHHGRIVVESSAGTGTAFTLVLPVEAHQ